MGLENDEEIKEQMIKEGFDLGGARKIKDFLGISWGGEVKFVYQSLKDYYIRSQKTADTYNSQ